jgi:hypothetical protein
MQRYKEETTENLKMIFPTILTVDLQRTAVMSRRPGPAMARVLPAACALVRGPGTELQAPSCKLQASSCKLDKIKL